RRPNSQPPIQLGLFAPVPRTILALPGAELGLQPQSERAVLAHLGLNPRAGLTSLAGLCQTLRPGLGLGSPFDRSRSLPLEAKLDVVAAGADIPTTEAWSANDDLGAR